MKWKTGGEPDVVGHDKKNEYIFNDCSAESPKGRRSVCYDREGHESRKEYKPKNNAIASNWVKTPSEIRKLGGAIFADFRYGNVFVYHNGAESYYGARAFRGSLRV